MEQEEKSNDLAFSYDANSLLDEIDFGEDSFYTRIEILEHISSIVLPFIKKAGQDVVFVDFACGSNQFCSLLPCKTMAFDIAQVAKQHGAIVKDWFSVDSLPPNLIVGLNPPFGYQGASARKFVEHALQFKPKYMFLILPNIRWSPPGYNLVYQENLANDSFYNPITNKIHKEISTTFNIFELSPTPQPSNASPTPKPLSTVEITRKWTNKYPHIVLRRVGRSTTKQFYCATSEENRCYINKGEVYHGKTWLDTGHAVESDYFLKLYFHDKTLSLDRLIALCNLIFTNPEPGYERKQPHAITTLYIREMIAKWQLES